MSINNEQYQIIKEVILQKLQIENPLKFMYPEFIDRFVLEPPFYNDLIAYAKNDGIPFYIQGNGGFDGNGDPMWVIFQLK